MYKGLRRRSGRPPVVDWRDAEDVSKVNKVVGKDGGQS